MSMGFSEMLGRVVRLKVRRFGPPGAFLALSEDDRDGAPVVLLPGADIPEDTRVGDELEVFAYLDSEDRPVVTTRTPKLVLTEVAFLAVTDVTSFGAFVDWGLAKDLLVPRGEQTTEMRVGERYAVGVFIDDTGRLAGTMRVSEMLRSRGDFDLDEWIEGEAWRDEPEIGLFVIVERAFVGLMPASEPHRLARGAAARFRVTNVLADGKIELSLRGAAHEELEGDAKRILDALSGPGAPHVGDRSSPEEIRALFGLSKKAFKRATGRLLKDRAVQVDERGFFVPRRR